MKRFFFSLYKSCDYLLVFEDEDAALAVIVSESVDNVKMLTISPKNQFDSQFNNYKYSI